ncbi:hypothetical protein SAMN05216551_10391 [Chitinasiproducens palmae]|uniref:Uncharacterized protein n=1 Tax=Chitinasiproducens palmae TaxID=1770053 RepID=A0A1H2PM36_9BURK|nr:hypothetical protein SAMN05216551_10391 [Chitinasiproducens palmae]
MARGAGAGEVGGLTDSLAHEGDAGRVAWPAHPPIQVVEEGAEAFRVSA